jgi:hypothetical protein
VPRVAARSVIRDDPGWSRKSGTARSWLRDSLLNAEGPLPAPDRGEAQQAGAQEHPAAGATPEAVQSLMSSAKGTIDTQPARPMM